MKVKVFLFVFSLFGATAFSQDVKYEVAEILWNEMPGNHQASYRYNIQPPFRLLPVKSA